MQTKRLINGDFAEGTKRAEAILDQRTGARILDLSAASIEQVDAAVAGASKAFDA